MSIIVCLLLLITKTQGKWETYPLHLDGRQRISHRILLSWYPWFIWLETKCDTCKGEHSVILTSHR